MEPPACLGRFLVAATYIINVSPPPHQSAVRRTSGGQTGGRAAFWMGPPPQGGPAGSTRGTAIGAVPWQQQLDRNH